MKQQVRIIGGRYRGKKLSFKDAPNLRPTPDRVRETLFNWLMHDIHGARCLDAFAGSGALGFEALSRGAQQVVMLEQSPLVFKQLIKTAQSFDATALQIIQGDALDYLKHCQQQFDIVFLDPPFCDNHLPACLEQLASHCLADDGLVYLESPNQLTLDSKLWQPLKLKQAGQVVYALYRKQAF